MAQKFLTKWKSRYLQNASSIRENPILYPPGTFIVPTGSSKAVVNGCGRKISSGRSRVCIQTNNMSSFAPATKRARKDLSYPEDSEFFPGKFSVKWMCRAQLNLVAGGSMIKYPLAS